MGAAAPPSTSLPSQLLHSGALSWTFQAELVWYLADVTESHQERKGMGGDPGDIKGEEPGNNTVSPNVPAYHGLPSDP